MNEEGWRGLKMEEEGFKRKNEEGLRRNEVSGGFQGRMRRV